MSERVNFVPDSIYREHDVGIKVGGNKKKIIRLSSFTTPKSSGFSDASFLKHIGEEFARVMRLFTFKGKRSSCIVSSSSLSKSRSYGQTLDSQRAEAIEDCIEFLNSSSSLRRSNSVSSSCTELKVA